MSILRCELSLGILAVRLDVDSQTLINHIIKSTTIDQSSKVSSIIYRSKVSKLNAMKLEFGLFNTLIL